MALLHSCDFIFATSEKTDLNLKGVEGCELQFVGLLLNFCTRVVCRFVIYCKSCFISQNDSSAGEVQVVGGDKMTDLRDKVFTLVTEIQCSNICYYF
jgi:hypothetical protein